MLQVVRRALPARTRQAWTVAAVIVLAVLFALRTGTHAARAQPAPEPPPACDGLILRLNNTLTGVCRSINGGFACYGLDSLSATFRPGAAASFAAPGNRAALDDLRGLSTDPAGAGLMVSGAGSGRVKMIVFGGAETTPEGDSQGGVFTLTTSNNRPVCGRAASGMMLQTSGRPGRIVVNGVTIELASTALIIVGPEPIFDQDPRAQRRYGATNPAAPLCSGFDSDCSFGDFACAAGERLVYGPFCREDAYPAVAPGLYRVTLFGEGEVTAGATDFATFGERFMLAHAPLTLPGSYTFCWPGLEQGGSGFETIVEAAETSAAGNPLVDRITVDYLGEDCAADPATLGVTRDAIGFMTIYNVEGSVRVGGPSGAVSIPPGERLRVHYDGATPVRLDGPTGAAYTVDAPLAHYLAFGADGEGGLPAIVTDRPEEGAAAGVPGLLIVQVTTDPPQDYCFLSRLGVAARMEAANGVASVTLRRRVPGAPPGEAQFAATPMERRADGSYFAALDTETRAVLEFYVEAVDRAGQRVTTAVDARGGAPCAEEDTTDAGGPPQPDMAGFCAYDPLVGSVVCTPGGP